MFCVAQRFNQFHFGYYKKWVIDVDKCSYVPVTAHFMNVFTKEKKDVSRSLNSVWQWSLKSKRVSLHNLNSRKLLSFRFHRQDIHDIFIIPAKFDFDVGCKRDKVSLICTLIHFSKFQKPSENVIPSITLGIDHCTINLMSFWLSTGFYCKYNVTNW